MYVFKKLSTLLLASSVLIPAAIAQAPKAAKWTGVHVGVTGGVTTGDYTLAEKDGTDTLGISSQLSGARIGVQGGYDVKVKGFVVGALADWTWSNTSAKYRLFENNDYEQLAAKLKQITTVRGRVGRSFNRSLVYAHGGWLIASTELNESSSIANSTTQKISGTHNGYVVGAGLEYFVAPHFTVRTEYGFNQLGSINVKELSGAGVSTSQRPEFHSVTTGISYRF